MPYFARMPESSFSTTHVGDKAVVLLSGGQDSTTCLFWAVAHYDEVHAVIFDYGQRHQVEVGQAKRVAGLARVPYKLLSIATLAELGGSSLTDAALTVPLELTKPEELPNTFVPGRNLIFLTYAAAYAYQKRIHHLVTGVCETDYSGYPDCRQPFIDSAAKSLSLAMDYSFVIQTPLMRLDKAEIWLLAAELGCLDVVINDSHTCYNGNRSLHHAWGYGCGECASCRLRAMGYDRAFGKKRAG